MENGSVQCGKHSTSKSNGKWFGAVRQTFNIQKSWKMVRCSAANIQHPIFEDTGWGASTNLLPRKGTGNVAGGPDVRLGRDLGHQRQEPKRPARPHILTVKCIRGGRSVA
eukprot:4720216-Prymnesium_polylepis.1